MATKKEKDTAKKAPVQRKIGPGSVGLFAVIVALIGVIVATITLIIKKTKNFINYKDKPGR